MGKNPGIPKTSERRISKIELFRMLKWVDEDHDARSRILRMENSFRSSAKTMVDALPGSQESFAKFKTNPYVLLLHACEQNLAKISDMESALIPAKVFSSMETSAGKMIEKVTLPIYGWSIVESGMQTHNSVLDGAKVSAGTVCVASLKSGPSCLNDSSAENIASSIVTHAGKWAADANATAVDFTYGVLYGTPKLSNKKDWHVLRLVGEKVINRGGIVLEDPFKSWSIRYTLDDIDVSVDVRIGSEWWEYLGGITCIMEVWVAMIRACIVPSIADPSDHSYFITDLERIVDRRRIPAAYNVSILQDSQLPWFLLVARHFFDVVEEGLGSSSGIVQSLLLS